MKSEIETKEQINQENGKYKIKKTLEDWNDYSDNENQEGEKKQNKVQTEKKAILKDQYGNIIINKLDTYVEPTRQIREARGDVSKILKIDYFF